MYDKLTKSDIKKMEEEIEYRKLVVRKESIEAVKEARAQGDLSENFEYYAAKKDKNKNESRIRYLERMIKTAQIVDDSSKEDEIGINKKLLGEQITAFYCLDCLADYLGVSVQDIMDKIEEFKDQGCKLFE